MRKPKLYGQKPFKPIVDYSTGPLRSVDRSPVNSHSRIRDALRNEASFLRAIGYTVAAEQIETAADAIGFASSERILRDLRL